MKAHSQKAKGEEARLQIHRQGREMPCAGTDIYTLQP